VTIWKDHACCDGCPQGGEAVISIMEPWFEQWARIEMQSGSETHQYPSCQRKRDRGWLGHDYVIE
jgi:hypothetical protein